MSTKIQAERMALNAQLRALSFEAVLAFALSCAERLYPNYVAFSLERRWGNPEALRQALALGWMAIRGGSPASDELMEVHRKCMDARPDTEEFDSLYVSAALDAASVACLVLEYVMCRDVSLVVGIASLCLDTVDMYVQELEGMAPMDSMLNEKIAAHPLMRGEVERQRMDLARLGNFSPTEDAVARLESEWRNPARSNIGLVNLAP